MRKPLIWHECVKGKDMCCVIRTDTHVWDDAEEYAEKEQQDVPLCRLWTVHIVFVIGSPEEEESTSRDEMWDESSHRVRIPSTALPYGI